jgi:hypothetical protein
MAEAAGSSASVPARLQDTFGIQFPTQGADFRLSPGRGIDNQELGKAAGNTRNNRPELRLAAG